MEENTSLFLFGDQTDDARSSLRVLLRTEFDPILETFVKKSYEAIRTELLRPLRVENRRDWSFSNLLELLDLRLHGPQRVALDHAITTICQFGLFFKRCHGLRGLYPNAISTNLVGLCTGSLAAAAISCCWTPSELLPVAVEVSVLSFRAGELAAETGARLRCNPSLSDSSWAIAIPGIEEEDASRMIDALVELKIASNLKLVLQSSLSGDVTLIPIANGAGQSLYQALKSDTSAHLSIADPILRPSASDDDTEGAGQSTSRSKIAIVGISGRFPSANDVSEFWDLLFKGLDVHKVVPPLRWDAKSHVDTSDKPRKNTSATPYGCWLDEPGLFDARFFGMSPREAEQADPAQRLALTTAYEALEDGGIVPGTRSTQSDRVGVVYGVTSNDWMETNSAQDIDTYLIPGGNRAFVTGRINYFFKFSGPSYAIDTACSSSLAAIHIACNVLWRGEADTMIAGGTNILTNPDFTAGLDRGRFLSRTGNCKTFDDEADGYCRGEGVGTVILKRLEDAILDNDAVKGVIVNACTNHSAEAESITRPNLKAQVDIFKKVLDGLSPANVSYIEMHGTGTQVGDATEMSSVLEAIAPNYGPRRRSETNLIHIGSVKPNVGHGEAAAGVTSLVKLLLMMQHNIIPPHCGIKSRINHKFPDDMAARGVRIATKPIDWSRGEQQLRHALLNNFSAAGGNTTLLLQDAPLEHSIGSDPRPTHPITISAKTFSALQANAKALLRFIQKGTDLHLSSLSYTTTARRIHHVHRIAVSGSSLQDVATNISTALQKETGKSRAIAQSVLFAFTGQGGHYIGMGRELYHRITSFRDDIDRYSQMAHNQGFSSFLPIIRDLEGDASSFNSDAMQLAITCLQMALARLWISWGIVPCGVIGHSLGHYAALNAAGVISEADTIFLVGTRARQSQDICRPGTHSMLAVRTSQSVIVPFLDGTGVDVACINGPQDIVLSGLQADIELVYSRLASQQIRGMRLDIPYAFHSSQVDCVLQSFESAMSGVEFYPPSIPVLCPRTEQVVREGGIFGPSIITTTIHTVVREELENSRGIIILRSDLSRPELRSVVQGHKVNGIPLCTPSIYADIALTVGRYLQDKGPLALKGKHISVNSMAIEKALIAQPTGPQWLQTVVKVDHESKTRCEFSTVDDDWVVIVHHASCIIAYSDPPGSQWLEEQALRTHADIDQLRQGLATDKCYRFNTSMIYRMVATLADFDRGYRGLKEIVLNSEAMAAASKMDFSVIPHQDGEVYCAHPAYVDSLSQSAGFVMNANEASDLEAECFVNHGWESFQLYEVLKPDELYQSYVQMAKGAANVWQGTLTVVSNEAVVAIFEGIKLQGVPPRLLHHVLSSANKTQRRTKQESNDDLPPDFADYSRAHIGDVVTTEPKADLDSALSQVVEIVAEESGIDKADLGDDTEFALIGIDSLLSLLITSRLKEDLNFDIGSGRSVFDEFSTLGQLKAASPFQIPERASILENQTESARPVTSAVLQQADINSTERNLTLFLFPDGSGSASSYTSLPQISPRIKRRQPDGAYSLGGWSSGGVCAYRAAQMLLDAGATVRDLILMDSPPPNDGLERLPTWFYKHCSDVGGVRFLTERRTEFVPGKWAELVPGAERWRVEVMRGWDHFNMMYGEGAKALCGFLERALTCSVRNNPS
ncbi:ketoacyl-synt-domain-containing protein [Glonium stellatum]|uniref:Ketoacyl-synt-domain-containing protein n=1 Tax=Glonium stellatum TaxID=574774 RepID=A0A8E2EVN4_9PEZI|nr:ketoacyl-synt-domain-containing protein [Glonium stellatum]